jgi:hypothetical protein
MRELFEVAELGGTLCISDKLDILQGRYRNSHIFTAFKVTETTFEMRFSSFRFFSSSIWF